MSQERVNHESTNDLISRADAIEAVAEDLASVLNVSKDETRELAEHALSALPSADITETEECQKCQEAMERVLLNKASAEAVQGWIPCSERLPKEGKKTYWVCTDTEHQCECRWTNNRFGIGEGEWGWSIFDTPQYTKPVAWMPLPKPYKGGDTDDV